MESLLGYSLSDFIPFSPATYLRMIERYQADNFPIHWIGWAGGLGLLWLVKRGQGRAAALALAVCWIWIGLIFQRGYYAELNWAAGYFAWAFALEGVLLGVASAEAELAPPAAGPSAMIRIAVIGHPLFTALSGANWMSGGFFATAPDPTAAATLGLALAFTGWRRWVLSVIPLAWFAIGLLTALGMNRPALGFTAGLGLALFTLFSIWPGRVHPVK
jgi:hypothetical protein